MHPGEERLPSISSFIIDCLGSLYIQGEVTSQSLWSRYDRHFVGITRYDALSKMAKIYRVTEIELNQLVGPIRKCPYDH